MSEQKQQLSSDASDDATNVEGAQRSGREHRKGRGRHNTRHRSIEESVNMEELREIVELISAHGFTDFELENKDVRVRLRRELAPQIVTTPGATATVSPTGKAGSAEAPAHTNVTAPAVSASGAETQSEDAKVEDEDLQTITSPIVGTFFRAPSPNAEPFVRLGSQVGPDSIVCIIEAMKLMNEIQAETAGVVAKIYVENGQPVEFGQPLFGIKK